MDQLGYESIEILHNLTVIYDQSGPRFIDNSGSDARIDYARFGALMFTKVQQTYLSNIELNVGSTHKTRVGACTCMYSSKGKLLKCKKAKEVKERLERDEAETENKRQKQAKSEPQQQKSKADLRPAEGKEGQTKIKAETRGGGYHPSCSDAPSGSSGSSSIEGGLFATAKKSKAMEKRNSSIECSKAGL